MEACTGEKEASVGRLARFGGERPRNPSPGPLRGVLRRDRKSLSPRPQPAAAPSARALLLSGPRRWTSRDRFLDPKACRRRTTMTPTAQAKIHIERMMHRSSIAVAGDSAASYALVKLIPAGGGTGPLALNLAL